MVLGLPPYDAFGRPNTMYHVPHLDFNLQVTSEFQSVSSDDDSGSGSASGSGSGSGKLPQAQFMRFAPARGAQAKSGPTHEIYSTISGRFVATVPNEGLPQTIIQIKSGTPAVNGTWMDIELEVEITNAVGEVLPNSLVEFNYDDDTTLTLNPSALTNVPTFDISEVRTDSNGKSVATVSIWKDDYDNGLFTVVKVNVGTVEKSISLSNS